MPSNNAIFISIIVLLSSLLLSCTSIEDPFCSSVAEAAMNETLMHETWRKLKNNLNEQLNYSYGIAGREILISSTKDKNFRTLDVDWDKLGIHNEHRRKIIYVLENKFTNITEEDTNDITFNMIQSIYVGDGNARLNFIIEKKDVIRKEKEFSLNVECNNRVNGRTLQKIN